MMKIKVLAIASSIFLIGCVGSTRHAKLRSEPDGFKGIKWGTEISTLKDMERVEQDKSFNSDLVWYIREGDALTIGKAKLENIFYCFWMGNFESVWIDFKGEENFEALKEELFKLFGKALGSEEHAKKRHEKAGIDPSKTEREDFLYTWWGKNTDVLLSYSKDRHKGTLDILSTKISEERRAYEKEKEKEERLRKGGF
jgi:hypothetical protein